MLRNNVPLPSLSDVEFRCFSQNGEDGILLFLFALIGTTNKRVVEICAGNGIECNSANLIINHGWRGLLVDGSEENVAAGKKFYDKHKDTWLTPPTLVSAWITRENVDQLITSQGFAGEIDLLSVDLDGNDYWIWEAIESTRPRLVVVEHNLLLGADRPVTIPYRENFVADLSGPHYYCGASLAAFVKLGRQKGYRLVGAERRGFNAFFARAGVGEDVLPELTVEQCVGREFLFNAGPLTEAQRDTLKMMSGWELVEV
ncbi:MAG TPA: hypothetical protein VJ866_22395 [Pyrinomonadaceae bacterium]|nr:hypothetical protein [Pyrinomonadaceae bacterium]